MSPYEQRARRDLSGEILWAAMLLCVAWFALGGMCFVTGLLAYLVVP